MTQRQFGELLGWGNSTKEAVRRIESIDIAELKGRQVSLEIVKAWTAFYRAVLRDSPKNPSASGRIKLLKRIAKNWDKG